MKIQKLKKFLTKKKYYYVIFFIFILSVYDVFTNSYILLRNNYQNRMLQYGGYCDKQAYGFIKFINDKYKNLENLNINVLSFANYATAEAYFFDTSKARSEDYLILISPLEVDLNKIYLKKYKIIDKQFNCYFLKKNA
jgi:hypothetical protein